MNKKHYEAVVIGGGSAGLSAAIELKKQGVSNIVILEKDGEPGGILEQCIHNGFGLQTFREQLSGPAYAERYIRMAQEAGVEIKLNAMVTKLTSDRRIEYVSAQEGVVDVTADAVILAVGCYERPRGAVNIMGPRCAGVYTAGQAQKYLNMEGYLVGERVFILGSGDIGLIMARRMTLEGAKVLGVAELMPYSNGLPRNMKQCLEDFDIPLYLSHTVTKTYGKERLKALEIQQVDENRRPIPGTEKRFEVDTLLLSVGLIPENHLADACGILMDRATRGPVVDDRYMTSAEGIFACGNGLHVHDLVDFVSLQAARAGEGAARYLRRGSARGESVRVMPGANVGYAVPSVLYPQDAEGDVEVFFRVQKPMDNVSLTLTCGGDTLKSLKKKKMIPSEMERIVLKKDMIAGLSGSVTLSAEEMTK